MDEKSSNCTITIEPQPAEDIPLLNAPTEISPSIFEPEESEISDFQDVLEECPICFSAVDADSLFRLKCGDGFCRNCLLSFLRQSIKEARITIPCPNPDCQAVLHPNDIELFLRANSQEALINKYHRFVVRKALLKNNRHVRWCPNDSCDYAVITGDRTKCPDIECKNCHQNFCFACRSASHPGAPCSKEGMVVDPLTKACPYCRVTIRKTEGCNDMRCEIPYSL